MATWSSRACPTGWRERSRARSRRRRVRAPTPTRCAAHHRTSGPPTATSDVDPTRPLAGLRVFDFTSYWAGPYAAQILGFLGADVIKVESVQRPDGTRLGTAYSSVGERPWELAPLFHGANTNKRDVTLDFTDADGLAIARRLLATCDVMIENYTPRVLERFGLLDDELRKTNPGLIVLRMPAWGLDGEWRDRPGFAQTMEQVTGLAWVTGHPGARRSCRAALRSTGRAARHVRVARRASNTVIAPEWGPRSKRRWWNRRSTSPPSRWRCSAPRASSSDATATGAGSPHRRTCTARQERSAGWRIAVETDAQWSSLRAALGDPEWARDPRLATRVGRHAARDDIDRELAPSIANADRDELAARLVDAGVPVAPVVNPRVVVENEQHAARGFYEPVVHPVAGEVRIPGFPARWDRRERRGTTGPRRCWESTTRRS